MNIAQVFKQQAQNRPQHPALIAPDAELSFAELEDRIAKTAALFQQRGIEAGQGVLVFVPMSIALYVVLVALFRLGAVAMFLDPSAGRAHIERCCKLYPPQGFVGTPKAHLLKLVSPFLRKIPHQFVTGGWLPGVVPLAKAGALAPRSALEAVGASAPALVTFTSGSTGQPKVAVRSHAFLLHQHRVLEKCLGYGPQDVVVSTLPIFVLSHLGSGVTSLIPNADLRRPGAVDAAPIAAQIQSHQATGLEASPAFLECFVNAKTPIRLPSLRKTFTGGAPVFPTLLDGFGVIAAHADVVAVYGSTEAEPIAEISRAKISAADLNAMRQGAGLLAGPPVDDIALKILPDTFGTPIEPISQSELDAQALAANEAGEIVVSGNHVLQGYWQGAGDEETKFVVDGNIWHRTGDAGYLDPNGRLWLLGRCSARIRDDNGTIYPFAVEAALSGGAQLRRSAFVFHRGRRVLAAEFAQRPSGEQLNELKTQLAWAKLDEVLTLKIPVDKRHNAKVDYPALKQLLEQKW